MLPIPVILNLSSWASKKAPLQCWLIDQLQLVYGIPSRFSQAWLDQDQWLLLLDGLDEVEETSRLACIEAINAYREEHFAPLVVCSRSNEYEYLSQQDARLALPSAVVVQPLEEAQVTEYLKRLGKSMAAVRAVVRGDPILRQLITTPLMLHVIVLAYKDKATRDLPQLGSPEELQRQIFDRYIQRMLELQITRAQFTPQQTQRWLIWLAQQMKQRHLTEFYLEWLQPSWLVTKRAQIAYRMLSGLVGGLVYGLPLGLVGELVFWLVSGPFFGLVSGLFVGLVFGSKDIHPAEIFTWSWKNFWQGLDRGLVGGLAFGLVSGLIFWLVSGLAFGLVSGPVYGLAFGLASGLVFGISGTQVSKDIHTRPNQGIRKSGRNALRLGLFLGLVSGLFLGLVLGLVGGLVFGGQAYFSHYILRYILSRSGVMPWLYVRFLEEKTECILLQRVGGGYRFVHALFLDYFASLETEASSDAVQPSPPQA